MSNNEKISNANVEQWHLTFASRVIWLLRNYNNTDVDIDINAKRHHSQRRYPLTSMLFVTTDIVDHHFTLICKVICNWLSLYFMTFFSFEFNVFNRKVGRSEYHIVSETKIYLWYTFYMKVCTLFARIKSGLCWKSCRTNVGFKISSNNFF